MKLGTAITVVIITTFMCIFLPNTVAAIEFEEDEFLYDNAEHYGRR